MTCANVLDNLISSMVFFFNSKNKKKIPSYDKIFSNKLIKMIPKESIGFIL